MSRTTVIIEVSKQAVPKWKDKLKAVYGLPRTSKVNNTLFSVSVFGVILKITQCFLRLIISDISRVPIINTEERVG